MNKEPKKKPKNKKYQKVTKGFLEGMEKYYASTDYPEKRKWMLFCEHFVGNPDYQLKLKKAITTCSRYIYVYYKDFKKPCKIRFSNHSPNKFREKDSRENRDNDFFVGKVNNGPYQTYKDAIAFVEKYNFAGEYTDEVL